MFGNRVFPSRSSQPARGRSIERTDSPRTAGLRNMGFRPLSPSKLRRPTLPSGAFSSPSSRPSRGDARTQENLAHRKPRCQTDHRSNRAMDNTGDLDVSGLLQAWGKGQIEARDQLLPLVYQELQRRANAFMRRERV